MDDHSPPPPPPPPLLKSLPLAVETNHLPPSTSSLSLGPSLFIITAILAFVIVASVSIRLLLRLLSSSSSVAPASLLARSNSSGSVTSAAALSDKKKPALIDSLPLFNLASSLADLLKSSPDCAVCLLPFGPDEDLRLLPSCRHAFHSGCVEAWIRNSPSCPLCRAPITLPPPPLHSPSAGDDPSRSGRLWVETSSISSRRAPAEDEPRNPSLPCPLSLPLRHPTYSIGSSFDYPTEEEEDIEAVVARIRRRTDPGSPRPSPPGEEVAREAGEGSRGWLRDYMGRAVSSASSSFRFSGRWMHHREYDVGDRDGGGGRQYSVHWEPEEARREAEVNIRAIIVNSRGSLHL